MLWNLSHMKKCQKKKEKSTITDKEKLGVRYLQLLENPKEMYIRKKDKKKSLNHIINREESWWTLGRS